MNRTFDFYEYAGVIIPGAVLILGLLWLFPDGRAYFAKDGVTFGEFGVFVILAYAAGQLVQGIGNGIEWIFWKLRGGLPSTRVVKNGAYIGTHQHKQLLEAIKADFGVTEHDLKPNTTMQLSVVRQIYAVVSDAKKTQRLDVFVGNYGLARGLAAALFILLLVSVIVTKSLVVAAVLVVLLLLALQRMHRFGRHYATELVAQFLSIKRQRVGS
jgi:hypothetical protein